METTNQALGGTCGSETKILEPSNERGLWEMRDQERDHSEIPKPVDPKGEIRAAYSHVSRVKSGQRNFDEWKRLKIMTFVTRR